MRSDIEVRSRIDEPVRAEIVDELSRKFADFRRANTEGGISIEEFDSFAPTRRTLAAVHYCLPRFGCSGARCFDSESGRGLSGFAENVAVRHGEMA